MGPDRIEALLENRRSIRRYKPDPVPELWIERMLHCAIQAPSPSNSQPVRYVRIISDRVKRNLLDTMRATRDKYLEHLTDRGGAKRIINRIRHYWRYSVFMFDAPVLFAAGTVPNTGGLKACLLQAGLMEDENTKDSDLDISLGLSLMSFILKAETLGLGTCILSAPLGFVPDIGEAVPAGSDISIKCFLTAGFPDEAGMDTPRKPVSDILGQV